MAKEVITIPNAPKRPFSPPSYSVVRTSFFLYLNTDDTLVEFTYISTEPFILTFYLELA